MSKEAMEGAAEIIRKHPDWRPWMAGDTDAANRFLAAIIDAAADAKYRGLVEASRDLHPPTPIDYRIALLACKGTALGPKERAEEESYERRWDAWRKALSDLEEA